MPDFYFARYLPLLIHILVAGGVASAIVLLSYFIGQHKYNKSKMSPYECGMEPVGNARQRFTVKFYLVAMLFILFDVEAVFLYPWAIVQRDSESRPAWACSGSGRCWCTSASCSPVTGTLEEGRARLEQTRQGGEDLRMALEPAITDLEQLKDRPEVARLLAWNAGAVTGAKFDRNELTIWVDRTSLREACLTLKNDPQLQYNALADITCVDWYPKDPRFEVVYQLFSIPNKTYLRLKVKLSGDDASLDSLVPIWPGANFFEREVFDLFGIRFDEHPNLTRIMMPEDWEGHPLRKDYPVEGYR